MPWKLNSDRLRDLKENSEDDKRRITIESIRNIDFSVFYLHVVNNFLLSSFNINGHVRNLVRTLLW